MLEVYFASCFVFKSKFSWCLNKYLSYYLVGDHWLNYIPFSLFGWVTFPLLAGRFYYMLTVIYITTVNISVLISWLVNICFWTLWYILELLCLEFVNTVKFLFLPKNEFFFNYIISENKSILALSFGNFVK